MRQCPAYSRGPDNLQFVSVKYIHCYLKITGGIGVIKNLKDQYLKTSASKTKTKFWLNTAKKKIISVNYPLKRYDEGYWNESIYPTVRKAWNIQI